MRYVEQPGVRIDATKVPAALRPLLPLALRYAVFGDSAGQALVEQISDADLSTLVARTRPVKRDIESFALDSPESRQTPVPDEAVVFQMFAWNLLHLEVEHRRRGL